MHVPSQKSLGDRSADSHNKGNKSNASKQPEAQRKVCKIHFAEEEWWWEGRREKTGLSVGLGLRYEFKRWNPSIYTQEEWTSDHSTSRYVVSLSGSSSFLRSVTPGKSAGHMGVGMRST